MNHKKIIELAKKIKILSEKGKDGEKIAAKEKLERLCKKYNISEDEIIITEDTKDYYIILRDCNEKELLINICCMILDVPGFKWKEKNNCVRIHITSQQYEDIYSAFEYYREMYDDYKRYIIQGMISRNTICYIPKQQTYTQENVVQPDIPTPPPQKDENVSDDLQDEEIFENNDKEDKKSEDKSTKTKDRDNLIDPIKLIKIAVALERKPWVKVERNKKLIDEDNGDIVK